MKNLPCFEIAIKDGKTLGYDKDKFFCRLSVPTSNAQDTKKWLNDKGASVLVTEFEESYHMIFFSTSNMRIINTIFDKYGAIGVEKSILLDKVRKLIKQEKEWLDDFFDIEMPYEDPNVREAICYTTYYLDCMEKSNERGWFYA